MGTWGTGPFDNDLAMDMVASLADEGLAPIRAAFTFLQPPDELDAICAAEVVAAAELVAALLGRPTSNLPEDVVAWASANASTMRDVALLRDASLPLIDIVLSERCELLLLWRKNEGEYSLWHQQVDDLRSRLQRNSPPP